MRTVFIVLAPPLGIFAAAIFFFIVLIYALITQPVLALVPIGLLVAGGFYFVRRDRRIQDEREAEINEGRGPYR